MRIYEGQGAASMRLRLQSIKFRTKHKDADVEIVNVEKPVLSISRDSTRVRYDEGSEYRSHANLHGDICVELLVDGETRRGEIPLNDSFSGKSGFPESYTAIKACKVEGNLVYDYRWLFPVCVDVKNIRHVKDWKWTADVSVKMAEQSA